MRIAAITDDGKTISQHFGRARHYLVFTVEDGRILQQELRDKAGHHTFAPQGGDDHHGSGPHGFDPASRNRHAQMLAVIADCQAVVAGGMGLGMQRNLEEIDGRLAPRPELAH